MTTETTTDLTAAEEAKKLLDQGSQLYNNAKHYPPLQDRCADLARTVIALHAQLADAQAAQAMVVERCADEVAEIFRLNWIKKGIVKRRLLRSLADPTGVALLAELRAERDAWKRLAVAGELTARNLAIVEAERDAIAALEAKVAGLVKNLRWIKDRLPLPPIAIEKREERQARGDYEAQEWLDAMYDAASCARAALATQEAGT